MILFTPSLPILTSRVEIHEDVLAFHHQLSQTHSLIQTANHSLELLQFTGARLFDKMSKLYQVAGSQGLQFHFGNKPEFAELFEAFNTSMKDLFPKPFPLNPPAPSSPELHLERSPTPQLIAGPSTVPEVIIKPAQAPAHLKSKGRKSKGGRK